MRRIAYFTALGGLLLVLSIACANPAANAPEATVEEPAPTPETSPEATGDVAIYTLTEDSTVGFVGSKVTGSHDGGFQSFEGEISLVGGTAEGSSVHVVIDTTSLWSDNDNLTGHLKSADFFEVATYPTATFTSTEVTLGEDGTYTLTGNLDLHGVTKQISFPAAIEVTDGGISATAEFSIKRFDFGIVYPGKADDLIRDEVLIKLDLRAAPESA